MTLTMRYNRFEVFVQLRSDVSEHNLLIFYAFHELIIWLQYSLVTLAEFEVVDSEVRLVHISHVNCGLR